MFGDGGKKMETKRGFVLAVSFLILLSVLAVGFSTTRGAEIEDQSVIKVEDQEPEVETKPATDISLESAILHGELIQALEREVLWRHDFESWIRDIHVVDDIVYNTIGDGVSARDAGDGSFVWEHEHHDAITRTVSESDGIVYSGSNDNRVVAADSEDGSKIWEHMHHDTIVIPVFASEGVIYSGCTDDLVIAADAQNGSKIWEHGHHEGTIWSIFASEGEVYSGSADDTVIATDAEDGSFLWKHDHHEGTVRSVYESEGVVYSGSADETVIATDAEDGSFLWKHEHHEGTVRSVYVSDGVVYSSSEDNTVIAYDFNTEEVLWQHEYHESSVTSVFEEKGVVYSGSLDDTIIAYGSKPVDVFFRYREEEETEWIETPSKETRITKPFDQTVENLQPDITYEFKAVAQWDDGTEEVVGEILTFTTKAEPFFKVEIVDHDDEVVEGRNLEITAKIHNIGDIEDTQDIKLYDDDFNNELQDAYENLTLGADESEEITLTWKTKVEDVGTGIISVQSEDDYDAVEVRVLEKAYFQVTIDLVESDEEVLEGEDLNVVAVIENLGEEQVTQTIKFYDIEDPDTILDSEDVTLGDSEVQTITMTWETEVEDHGDYTLEVASEDDQEQLMVTVLEVVEYYELMLTIVGEGTVTLEYANETYEIENEWNEEMREGIEVTLTANPNNNYRFDRWGGDYPENESKEEQITIIMDDDRELIANFEKLEAFFKVEVIDYDEEVIEGDEVTIMYRITNTGNIEGTQTIIFEAAGEIIDTMELTLEAGEVYESEFIWEAVEEGDYDVGLTSEDDQSWVTITVEEEDEWWEVPGFTTMLLISGAIIAVTIYYKKEQ